MKLIFQYRKKHINQNLKIKYVICYLGENSTDKIKLGKVVENTGSTVIYYGAKMAKYILTLLPGTDSIRLLFLNISVSSGSHYSETCP